MGFKYFLRRKPPELKILELIDKHLELCTQASDLLTKAMYHKQENDAKEAEKLLLKVMEAEEKADYQRRSIIDQIAHGILPPINKEDMMNLIIHLDSVIDWTDTSGNILNIMDLTTIPESIKKLFAQQVRLSNQCVHALSETIRNLYTDYAQALDQCNLVEIIEHEMDNTYIEIHRELYTGSLSVNEAIMVKELADSLECIGDSCEDTSDLVRVVIVSAFR